MSPRYECVAPDAEVGCYEADEIESGHRGLALVIGDPEATAIVIIGDRSAIVHLLARAKQALAAYPTKRIAIADSTATSACATRSQARSGRPHRRRSVEVRCRGRRVLRIEVREG